jgi:hypothetical protein
MVNDLSMRCRNYGRKPVMFIRRFDKRFKRVGLQIVLRSPSTLALENRILFRRSE